jgi:hypothetical protein
MKEMLLRNKPYGRNDFLQNSPYGRSVLSNKKACISGEVCRPLLRAFRYKLNAGIIISSVFN